jgi:hypothetical protein
MSHHAARDWRLEPDLGIHVIVASDQNNATTSGLSPPGQRRTGRSSAVDGRPQIAEICTRRFPDQRLASGVQIGGYARVRQDT